jgi:NAD(P)-dependent dehydrogenase (short-subunit alcohol dehydrogenase family)
MAPKTVYLITGASRGIGLGLVKELATRHTDIAIVACVRDLGNVSALKEVVVAHPDTILVVKYIAGDVENNQGIANEVKQKFGGLDIVIANAGVCSYATQSNLSNKLMPNTTRCRNL